MSRWINIDNLPTSRVEWDDIIDAPSIDIVRCKECKHWDNTDNAERCSYEYGGMWAKPDDFCSYGICKTNTTAEEKLT